MDATNLGPAELAKEEESPTVIFQFDVCHGMGLSRIGTSEPTSGILLRSRQNSGRVRIVESLFDVKSSSSVMVMAHVGGQGGTLVPPQSPQKAIFQLNSTTPLSRLAV